MLEGMGRFRSDYAVSDVEGGGSTSPQDGQVTPGREDSRTKDDLVQGDSSPRELSGRAMQMHESKASVDPGVVVINTNVSDAAAADSLEVSNEEKNMTIVTVLEYE